MVDTKAGRRVEVTIARGTIEVTEVTRSGQPVRSARFMATRVVAVVEYPSESNEGPESKAARPSPPENQAALDL